MKILINKLCARARVLSILYGFGNYYLKKNKHFVEQNKKLLIMFSENGINNNSSPQYKDNNFILSSHDNNSYNNNLNSYAKSTPNSTNSSNVSSPTISPTSPTPSPSSFAQQLRILIPNYDDLMDTIRSQQPHSSRAGLGMQNDRRNMNMMNDRRMMDRQMVSMVLISLNGFGN